MAPGCSPSQVRIISIGQHRHILKLHSRTSLYTCTQIVQALANHVAVSSLICFQFRLVQLVLWKFTVTNSQGNVFPVLTSSQGLYKAKCTLKTCTSVLKTVHIFFYFQSVYSFRRSQKSHQIRPSVHSFNHPSM